MVAVAEGLRDPAGEPFGADLQIGRDGDRRLASNLGHALAGLLPARLGLRTRNGKSGLMGRSNGALNFETDRSEAFRAGAAAARAALGGEHEVMVALQRIPGVTYHCETILTPLAEAAVGISSMAREWIGAEGNEVRPEFLDYVAPLAGEVQASARLEAHVAIGRSKA
jgi:6-phosphofructokinase 1